MCSVDRRRYRDGGFNGQWTSQLAPSQCSGTLFSLGLLPPDTLLSLSLPLVRLSFLFSLERARIPGLYATWKASGLKRDITGPRLAPPLPLRCTLGRNTENRGSYLIREEVYSPVDSNWARNHRALLSSVRSLKKTLTNSRFLAYYCPAVPPFPPPCFAPLSPPFALQQFHTFLRGRNSFPPLTAATTRRFRAPQRRNRLDDFLRERRSVSCVLLRVSAREEFETGWQTFGSSLSRGRSFARRSFANFFTFRGTKGGCNAREEEGLAGR